MSLENCKIVKSNFSSNILVNFSLNRKTRENVKLLKEQKNKNEKQKWKATEKLWKLF